MLHDELAVNGLDKPVGVVGILAKLDRVSSRAVPKDTTAHPRLSAFSLLQRCRNWDPRLDVSGVVYCHRPRVVNGLVGTVLARKSDDIVTGDIRLNDSPSATGTKWS